MYECDHSPAEAEAFDRTGITRAFSIFIDKPWLVTGQCMRICCSADQPKLDQEATLKDRRVFANNHCQLAPAQSLAHEHAHCCSQIHL